MLLPVYSGRNYSFCYEPETGRYLFFDNQYKHSVYLQGDDAKIFAKLIDKIDSLPKTTIKTAVLIETAISNYL